jgi:hypothetical protein
MRSAVHATLVYSSIVAYQLFATKLSESRRERYQREMNVVAELFGVPGPRASRQPRSSAAASRYSSPPRRWPFGRFMAKAVGSARPSRVLSATSRSASEELADAIRELLVMGR